MGFLQTLSVLLWLMGYNMPRYLGGPWVNRVDIRSEFFIQIRDRVPREEDEQKKILMFLDRS